MKEKGYKITKEGVYAMLRRKKEYLEAKQEAYTRIRDISDLELYNYAISKKYTVDIEGNNCLFRHRMRRFVRKTCRFSKKMFNHMKAFC